MDKTLTYQTPSDPPSGKIDIEKFPDGGVTIHIPHRRSGAGLLIATATALALSVVLVALSLLLNRFPALFPLSMLILLISGVATIVQVKSRIAPPDVIAFSRTSMYVATSQGFARRQFEAPLHSLQSIKILPINEQQKGSPPGSIELEIARRPNVVLCGGRWPREITRVAETLIESRETLRAAEDAPIRSALDVFLRCCNQDSTADDRTLFQHLTEAGIDRLLAARLTLIVPIAFARARYKDHASFHSYCLVVDEDRRPLRRFHFQDDRAFAVATELFTQLASDPAQAEFVSRVADRSPETAVIKKQPHRRHQPRLSIPPPRIRQFMSLYNAS